MTTQFIPSSPVLRDYMVYLDTKGSRYHVRAANAAEALRLARAYDARYAGGIAVEE